MCLRTHAQVFHPCDLWKAWSSELHESHFLFPYKPHTHGFIVTLLHCKVLVLWKTSFPFFLCRGILQKHLPFSPITLLLCVLPTQGVGKIHCRGGHCVEGAVRRGGGGTFCRRKVIFLSQCEWSFWQFRLPFLCFIPQRRQDCCKIFSSHKSHLAVYALCSSILWVWLVKEKEAFVSRPVCDLASL